MRTIAVFHSTATGSSLPKITGICRAAWNLGLNVQRFDFRNPRYVRETLDYWRPDGCIAEVGAHCGWDCAAVFGSTPVVLFDGDPSHCCGKSAIVQDAQATVAAALGELDLLGLASIACVAWPQKEFWSERRVEAFRSFVKLRGHDATVFRPRRGADNAAAIRSQLSDWLKELPKPVGVFAVTDAMSVQVLEAARARGMDVPGDVAIIGVDDEEFVCDYARPTLSSVRPDFEAAGRRSVEMLMDVISGRVGSPMLATFPPPNVVRRSSTRRTGRFDRAVAQAIDLIRAKAVLGIAAADVLAVFDCSRRQAEYRFRAATGHSVLDEIHAVQVEKAKLLLGNPMVKLSSVAGLCGHASSASFFQRLFTRLTGMTMRSWQESRDAGGRSHVPALNRMRCKGKVGKNDKRKSAWEV